MSDYYERNLPHWQPEGTPIFLTCCLHGSHGHARKALARSGAGRAFVDNNDGRTFVEMDRALDKADFGPIWLKIPAIAKCVEDDLHVVLSTKAELSRITKSLKGFTARQANEILGRTGERFWQSESYDHWVRSDRELQKIIKYVEMNPVRAGLVKSIESWPWSSAHVKAKTNSNTGMNACATPCANSKMDGRIA